MFFKKTRTPEYQLAGDESAISRSSTRLKDSPREK